MTLVTTEQAAQATAQAAVDPVTTPSLNIRNTKTRGGLSSNCEWGCNEGFTRIGSLCHSSTECTNSIVVLSIPANSVYSNNNIPSDGWQGSDDGSDDDSDDRSNDDSDDDSDDESENDSEDE